MASKKPPKTPARDRDTASSSGDREHGKPARSAEEEALIAANAANAAANAALTVIAITTT